MKNTLSATVFLSALILLSVFTLSTCGLPEGLEKSDCGKKSNIDCEGPYLKHYEVKSTPIRKLHGINRDFVTINPKNPEELMYVERSEFTDYELIIYNRQSKERKIVCSRPYKFYYHASPFGVVALPQYNEFINLEGEVIKRFDDKKISLHGIVAFSPSDSTICIAYYYEQFRSKLGLYNFENDEFIHEFPSNYVHWENEQECYTFKDGELQVFDFTKSYTKPQKVLFDFSELNPELYFSDQPISADLFNGNLLSISFGINLINIHKSTITKINNVDCHKVKIEYAIWDKLYNKILFIKNVAIANKDHEYVSENYDIYEMDIDGCNERRYFE